MAKNTECKSTYKKKMNNKIKNIPLFEMYWDNSDVEAVEEVIKSGRNWAAGSNISELETLMAKYLGVKYCALFNSGTSALHASLLSYNIQKGDEVIVPSFTFISTANASLFVGAKPVFADIEKKTLGLDPEDVIKKITSRTKAIIPVHYAGCPCKIDELKKIAEENSLILIEDAAEAFGAKIGEKKVGAFGDSAMFSFCQNKIITTGEGGAIVTNSKEIYDKLLQIRSHGMINSKDLSQQNKHVSLGYNFRMSNILAALGISQIKKVDYLVKLRKKAASEYNQRLSGMNEISLLSPPDTYYPVHQLYTILVEKRDELISHLSKNNISSKIYFEPVHLNEFYQKLGYQCDLPITEEISKKALSLPIYPGIKKEDIEFITYKIRQFYRSEI